MTKYVMIIGFWRLRLYTVWNPARFGIAVQTFSDLDLQVLTISAQFAFFSFAITIDIAKRQQQEGTQEPPTI